MLKNLFILLCFYLSTTVMHGRENYIVKSPDGKLQVNVFLGKNVEYTVLHSGDTVIGRSAISMNLADGKILGAYPKVVETIKRKINRTIQTPVYKKASVNDYCNELELKFKDDYSILFRAYNDGGAYRFVSHSKKPFIVENEQAEFNFSEDVDVHVAYVPVPSREVQYQFVSSFENTYEQSPVSMWTENRLGILPLLAEKKSGKKICITEADLMNYPGMFLLNSDKNNSLKGVFASYPKETAQGTRNFLQEIVKSREAYIAKYETGTTFPWRVVIVADNDTELLNNDMVYKLSTPSKGDFSWVKPGKVAWDWWNSWNLSGVDFEAGINNKTYEYYIDFASQHGIEYVILDEGWAVKQIADLMKVVPEIDLPHLVEYAAKRNVDLILWAGFYAFNKDIEGICRHYSEMGIKGFKIDFMDRDDQPMVNFVSKVSKIAAKYKLLVDFHGTYKPTGLQCTYPNVVNFEGVHGMEHMKWDDKTDQVTYDVTAPYIRMVAGPLDYTPGAMRNAIKANYRAIRHEPMSQGTRTRQLALYVIYEAPLAMLCDTPTNYEQEKECTYFIASVPTVWDETIALDGKITEHAVIARRKGADWYVAAITNWDKRTLDLNLSFLDAGNYVAEIFKDGVNASKVAKDYVKEIRQIPADRRMKIHLESGGGYVMKISPAK